MFLFISCILIFLVVFVLAAAFHSFFWNFDWCLNGSSIRSWVSSFECGFVSQPLTECYFSSTYFVLLVFFVVFDLEVSLLLNLPLQGILYKNFSYYLLFLCFLALGFGLEVSKGYVEWEY
uniref:NADH dehydrogenase subunit 3 n=1 Tax=Carassotrema koreanum TaxID=2573094 RepID=UPI00217695DA|nr:NADH dehydrogenase subunit 3 [Carassotrema koreanum]UUF92003.1 NADH dehydrogenase subunit 3 [Carassotrema koreanum]